MRSISSSGRNGDRSSSGGDTSVPSGSLFAADAAIYSAHGRELSVDRVMKRLCDPEEPAKRAFILMGGKNGAGQFCERLTQAGYGNVQVTVGENLSYPEEQIRSGTAEEMKKLEFADLSLILLEVTDSG